MGNHWETHLYTFAVAVTQGELIKPGNLAGIREKAKQHGHSEMECRAAETNPRAFIKSGKLVPLYDIHTQHGLYEGGADEARLAEMAEMVDALDTSAPFWRAWCDVEPIIITPAGSHGDGLPAAAREWINQTRDEVMPSPGVAVAVGNAIEYLNYGQVRKGRVVEILESGLLHVERLDGPMAGSIAWIHPESVVKE